MPEPIFLPCPEVDDRHVKTYLQVTFADISDDLGRLLTGVEPVLFIPRDEPMWTP